MTEPHDPGGGSKINEYSLVQINSIIGVSNETKTIDKNNKSDWNIDNEKSEIINKEKVNDVSGRKKNIPTKYKEHHSGPFMVYIESTDKTGNNVGKFNHLKIAKEIFNLHLNDIKNYKSKGTNRIAVEFNNFQAANNFIKNESLIKKGYNVFIPSNFTTCKGLVKRVDLNMTLDEIQSRCTSAVNILDMTRLNRKVLSGPTKIPEYIPTNTMLLTFEGTILPREITIYGLPMLVIPYVAPVTQCFQCFYFGHTKKLCKSKNKCFNCGEEDKNHKIEGNEGEYPQYECQTTCIHCKSDEHRSTNKKCPEFIRQQSIKRLMAFENLTYYDANYACKKTYSNSSDYVQNPLDFPALKNKYSINQDKIEVSQRRVVDTNTRPKRSYQQATVQPPKKRTITQTGYDKKAHNEALYFPNSRPTGFQPSQHHTNTNMLNQTAIPSTSMSTISSNYSNYITPIRAQENNLNQNNEPILEKLAHLLSGLSDEGWNHFNNYILPTINRPRLNMDVDYNSF